MLIFSLRIAFTGVSTTLAVVQNVRLYQLTVMVTEASCHWLIILVYNPSWCLLVTCYYDYMLVINWLSSLKNTPNVTDYNELSVFPGSKGTSFLFLYWRTWLCLENKLQILSHCYNGHQPLLTHSLYVGYKS